jgi:hypothetical protein
MSDVNYRVSQKKRPAEIHFFSGNSGAQKWFILHGSNAKFYVNSNKIDF